MKRAIVSLLLASGIILGSALSVQAKDILGPGADCGNGNAGTDSSAVCTDRASSNANPSDNPVVDKLHEVTGIIAKIAGAAAILLLLVGSLQFITSAGDSAKAASARNTIIYALIGIIVIVLAAAIIEFVIGYL